MNYAPRSSDREVELYAGSTSDSARGTRASSRSSSRAYREPGSSSSKRSSSSSKPPAPLYDNGHWDEESGGAVSDREENGRPSRRAPKGQPATGTCSSWCSSCRPLTVLAVCTVLFGPIGTIMTFLLLPAEGGGDADRLRRGGVSDEGALRAAGGAASHMRVLHLSLAHTNVKARFVIDERSDWDSFTAGCSERLKIEGVAKVTDANGHDQIHTIGDLVHEDNIVVHAIGRLPPNQTDASGGDGDGGMVTSASAGPAGLAGDMGAAPLAAGGRLAPAGGGAPAGALSVHGSMARVATSARLHVGAPTCPARHPDFRVAMLIPLLGPAPPYLPYFVASAARSAPLIDFLVFHEHLHLPWEQKHLPANVKFVDLGGGGLAELVGLKLGERLGLPLRNATTLLRSLRLLFERWPRLIAEYKPTFGTVFEDFLGDYSHWGYADLDMVIGNLMLFMERAELESEDIVTYAFGDMDALYLRGQWTVHRNRPAVNTIWQKCAHLGSELERELGNKVGALRQSMPTRFLSAEGCYSYEAVKANLRIKVANKQAVGLDVPSSQQVLFVAGSIWTCGGEVNVDDALLRELTERTGKEPCRTLLPPLQRPVGELSTLRWQPEGCGKWIPSEFRLCVADARQSLPADTRTVGVYAREGSFYAQTMEDAGLELENGCRQSAFFHFQVHHPPMRNALPARACVSENPLILTRSLCARCAFAGVEKGVGQGRRARREQSHRAAQAGADEECTTLQGDHGRHQSATATQVSASPATRQWRMPVALRRRSARRAQPGGRGGARTTQNACRGPQSPCDIRLRHTRTVSIGVFRLIDPGPGQQSEDGVVKTHGDNMK